MAITRQTSASLGSHSPSRVIASYLQLQLPATPLFSVVRNTAEDSRWRVAKIMGLDQGEIAVRSQRDRPCETMARSQGGLGETMAKPRRHHSEATVRSRRALCARAQEESPHTRDEAFLSPTP